MDPDDVRPVKNGKVEEYREKVVTFKDGKLGMAGWVKYDETDVNRMQIHFYKKPKRFSNA